VDFDLDHHNKVLSSFNATRYATTFVNSELIDCVLTVSSAHVSTMSPTSMQQPGCSFDARYGLKKYTDHTQ
jgi:hypothetical protein